MNPLWEVMLDFNEMICSVLIITIIIKVNHDIKVDLC